jgi:photosystem II stability/assembly factor-like uncharacterized protein
MMDNHLLFVGTDQGVVILQKEEDTWCEIGQVLESRRLTSLSAYGDAVLAGTTEGVFRSDDSGQTWRRSSEGLTASHVRWLAHHPDGSGRVLAGTEPAAIFLSRDGGTTWAERPEVTELRDEYGWYLPYSAEAGCVREFAFTFDGNRVYAAAEVGGLLHSSDGGETWQLAQGSSGEPHGQPKGFVHPDVHSVAAHPWSPDLVFAATGGGLFRSTDGGETWEHLYRCYCRAVWPDPAEARHLIFSPADAVDCNGRIEKTYDGGQTWEMGSEGLEVPWPCHMVERFLRLGSELLAMVSNGDLIAAPLMTLSWRYLLPDVGRVRALAATQA